MALGLHELLCRHGTWYVDQIDLSTTPIARVSSSDKNLGWKHDKEWVCFLGHILGEFI